MVTGWQSDKSGLILGRKKIFFLYKAPRTGYGGKLASHSMGNVRSFIGGKTTEA
jgi:hypothetical protein